MKYLYGYEKRQRERKREKKGDDYIYYHQK